MADGDRPERIEIELTSHVPSGDHVAAAEPVVDDVPTIEVARTKLWVGAAVVGLVALLMGFVLGRAGSGVEPAADDSSAASSSTIDPTPTTIDEALTTIEQPRREPFPGESTDATSRSSPTTAAPQQSTTTVERVDIETGSIAIDPALTDHEFTLVAVSGRGDVIDIDMATGSTETRSSGRFLLSGGAGVFVGPDWVMLPRFDGGRMSTVVFDDGTVAEIETGEGWSLLREPGTDRFWRPEDAFSAGPIVEFDLSGSETGRTIDLVGWPVAQDPLGGIVVHGSGGSYVVTPDGAMRLTTGTLVGIGRTVMLIHECDADFECAYAVVDRTTGDQQPFEPVGLSDSFHLAGWFGGPSEVSPGDDAMLLYAPGDVRTGLPTLGVLDLVTEEFSPFDASGEFSTATFTPDGEAVVFVRRGDLVMFDWRTGETIEVSPDLDNIQAVGVRPSG